MCLRQIANMGGESCIDACDRNAGNISRPPRLIAQPRRVLPFAVDDGVATGTTGLFDGREPFPIAGDANEVKACD